MISIRQFKIMSLLTVLAVFIVIVWPRPAAVLIPDKVLNVSADKEYVSIMMGVDGNRFVQVVLDHNQVYQGLQTSILRDVAAWGGPGEMYLHSPKKHGTTVSFTINTLTEKNRTAMVTIAAHLVLDNPDRREYLDIPPTTLVIKGKQFDSLVAK